MRVESDKPSRNGGWLHQLDTKPTITPHWRPAPPAPAPTIDAAALMQQFALDTTDEMICDLAHSLGVDCAALKILGAAWASGYNAYAFPMCDGAWNVIGIRLRSEVRKWAVTGSRQGIFLPQLNLLPVEISESKTAFICEGPSDASAALTMGLLAMGRPSCTGGTEQIQAALDVLKIREAVIIADADGPGQRGAEKLSAELRCATCIFTPPCKDVRELLALGGTKEFIEDAVKNLVWRKS